MIQEQEKLVMYVDGDYVVADAVKLFADTMHMGTIIAHTVEEAVNLATNALPQRMAALVFPSTLPDGQGIDLLNAKAGSDALFGDETAKVLVTADRSRATRGLYMNLGVVKVVYKPIGPKELTALVGEMVNRPEIMGGEN